MAKNNFNGAIINQIEELLEQFDDRSYSKSLQVLSTASIGQHIRHIIDFYLCIINESESQISYDNRNRDAKIEQDPSYALGLCKTIKANLNSIDLSKQILVKGEINGEKFEFFSSIGREMLYAFDHAVHHLALIKIGVLTGFPEIKVPDNLGVAPSTIKYRNQQCAP